MIEQDAIDSEPRLWNALDRSGTRDCRVLWDIADYDEGHVPARAGVCVCVCVYICAPNSTRCVH